MPPPSPFHIEVPWKWRGPMRVAVLTPVWCCDAADVDATFRRSCCHRVAADFFPGKWVNINVFSFMTPLLPIRKKKSSQLPQIRTCYAAVAAPATSKNCLTTLPRIPATPAKCFQQIYLTTSRECVSMFLRLFLWII